MTKSFTREEVAKHQSHDDCWIIINSKVYDVTKFLDEHPGGKKIIAKNAGKDVTQEFEKFHNASQVLTQYGTKLCIGQLIDTPSKKPIKITTPQTKNERLFGEGVPYGDPSWYQGWNSLYYNDSHVRFRAAMREFVETEIMPFVHEWDEAKAIPLELFEKSYAAGWLPAIVGKKWPTQYAGPHIAGGVLPDEYPPYPYHFDAKKLAQKVTQIFTCKSRKQSATLNNRGEQSFDESRFDAFHELIAIDEVCRCGSAGVAFSLLISLNVGLPPILHFGSKYLNDRLSQACLSGNKKICLAITEPSCGSDVASLVTEAKKTPDGKYYIVNGEKKWITGGTFADFFTVAVRTGGPGMGGISMMVIERGPGVTTRHMPCQGLWSGGTAYVTFEDVKVPVENLIGEENSGFKYIMYNFNHERWAMCIQALRFARVCFEESFKYAHKRKTFGQRLIDHPVIRAKLAHQVRQIESTESWLASITHQLNTMTQQEAQIRLGGAIALLKVQTSLTFEYCAREAAQIFGGLAYTRGGQGGKVERLYREVRGYAIPGGSEEILLDLGIRQAVRQAKL